MLKGENTTLYRLLMYSVLEEGKLADVYLKNPKAPIKDFINYIQQRIEANAFKQMIPVWLPLHLSMLVFTISLERECWRSPMAWMKYPQPLLSFFTWASKVSPSEVESLRHRASASID